MKKSSKVQGFKGFIVSAMVMLLGVTTGWAQDSARVTPTADSEAKATGVRFGYLSYVDVMHSLPEYVQMERDLQQLRAQYEAELRRVEEDFNKKYEEFLDGQASYPKSILQKRQSELQEMLDRNVAFKERSRQLLQQAEREARTPLERRLADALTKIGQERGFAFILNTDETSAIWVNPQMGEDVSEAVKLLLKK